MLLLASASYGAVRGGHVPQIMENAQSLCDDVANRLGFRIAEVALDGGHEVARDEILVLAGITDRSSLLFLDAARTRARLLSNPWIAEATVLKLYPDRLRIEIKERKPFALWQKDRRICIDCRRRRRIGKQRPCALCGFAAGCRQRRRTERSGFSRTHCRYPAIARRTEASIFIAERRWNLRLKDGVEILLPENEAEQALQILVDLDRNQKLLSRDIIAVDLRLPDRVTVRQSDAASFARDQALKEAEKAKKSKSGKGGEA